MATPYDLSGAYPNNPNAPLQQYIASLGGTNVAQGANATSGGDWSWLAPFLGGIGNLATARLGQNTANQAAGMADPFSGERQQYQTALRSYMGANPVNPTQVTAGSNNALAMLTNLLQNPGSLTTQPGYQFGLNQALESVNRGAGASGLLNSGNRLAALEDRGNAYAQSWQDQIFRELLGNVGANVNVANLGLGAQQQGYGQLARLAGADTGNPAAAGQMVNAGRQNEISQLGQGVGGLLQGGAGALAALQRIIGGGGGGWNGATPGAANDQWDFNPIVGGGDAGFPDNWDLMGGGWDSFGAGGIDLGSFL